MYRSSRRTLHAASRRGHSGAGQYFLFGMADHPSKRHSFVLSPVSQLHYLGTRWLHNSAPDEILPWQCLEAPPCGWPVAADGGGGQSSGAAQRGFDPAEQLFVLVNGLLVPRRSSSHRLGVWPTRPENTTKLYRYRIFKISGRSRPGARRAAVFWCR